MAVRPIESKQRSRNGLCCSVWIAGVLIACAAALGDPIGAGSGKTYRLGGQSSFQQGCFPPCMCPIMEAKAARGTFKLTYGGINPQGIHRYAVDNVNWTLPTFGPMVRIVGSGVYHIGSPAPATVLQHRMVLDLAVGDGPVEHFDSGWIPIDDLARVHITVSINGMYCWDRVIVIDAWPVPEQEVKHYQLIAGSTYQHGCFDPCDCILLEPRPLIGAFDLIPIFHELFETQFALVNVRWQVPAPAVTDSIPIAGFGVFRMGGDFAAEHQLRLELTVGDAPRTHFDSGVVLGGTPFPRLDEIVSMHGLVCLDTVLHVIAEPAAGEACGGIAGIPCTNSNEFCKLPIGHCCCDFMGMCVPMPTACPDVWDPVCGCDGVTYGNGCEADAAGVSISHYGPCGAVCRPADDGFGCAPVVCSDIPEEQCIPTVLQVDMTTGAITTADCACLDFNFCHIEFGNASPFAVGYCPGGGACTVVARDTDGDGVDDTFTAECSPSGACCSDVGGSPLPVPVCTLTAPDTCAPGMFQGVGTSCEPVAACCMTLIGTGYCVDTSPACCVAFGGQPLGPNSTCAGLPDPGVCTRFCGGFAGDTCHEGEFCKYPEGICSDATDHQGVCTPIPTGCPDVWDPVCGCDGLTYSNECDAAAASVSVLHRGECGPGACCLPGSPSLPPCLLKTRAGCAELGGAFQGPGTMCPTDPTQPCGLPTGACCHDVSGDPNSWCVITTQTECYASFGVYFGDGTDCPTDPTVPCGPPSGACCVADPIGAIGCFVATAEVCRLEGGDYQGDGTVCPPDPTLPCGAVIGACCLPDGTCLELPIEVCKAEGGSPLPGVSCTVVDCAPDPIGACCLPNAAGVVDCIEVPRTVCHGEGGEYQGDGTVCSSDPNVACPSPTACCLPDGACLNLPPAVCLHEGGDPIPDTTCDAVFCGPLPTGACCFPTPGTIGFACNLTTVAECLAIGGDYQGDGTSCPTDPSVLCGTPCNIPCPVGQHCSSGCGTLVHGVTCVLFQADSGGSYLLSDLGGFAVGDRVRVTGCIDPNCDSVCAQGDGCLAVHRIDNCSQPCGGIAGIPCDNPDEFCKFPEGTCDYADMMGACTPVPSHGCPEIYAPVCGCDGVTYVNECESDAASVSILRRGPCDGGACAATRRLTNAGATGATFCPGTPLQVHILLTPPNATSAIAVEDAPPAGWAVSNISHLGTYDPVNGKVKWGPLFPPFPSQLTYDVMPTPNTTGVACFTGAISVDGINRTICGDACMTEACCPRMSTDLPQPACGRCPFGDCSHCGDQACGNGHVTICELTSYACAWLTGCHDDMSGVTRAAYIWHNGECYCWDDALQNFFPTSCTSSASGCCTPGSGGGAGQILATGKATLRDAGNVKLPNRDSRARGLGFSVTIEASASTSAVALEVVIPQGWRITNISDEGAWDESHGKIKWGPYLDNVSRTVTFSASPTVVKGTSPNRSLRSTAPHAGFSGTVSFDGINRPIEIE